MKSVSTLAAVAALLSAASAATPPITTRGNAFYVDDTDERFYIKGLAYQPGGDSDVKDPISNTDGCRRDLEKFQELGINTLRVYTIDNLEDHDECMELLSEAGIYVALDVNNPKYSLNRIDPGPSYNDMYLRNVFATVELFAKYDNTLLFFAANEVLDENERTSAAPYVKAVIRDVKRYMRERDLRIIPVGYSAADVDDHRLETAQYMNCGSDSSRADFFAFNDYSWCGQSSFQISGYDKKVATYENYSIPLFFSEFGCIKGDRQFTEVEAIFSERMTGVYSGGIAYEYSLEPNDYGIVEINGDSVEELEDFESLKEAYESVKLPSGNGGARDEGQASECPARSDVWDVEDDTLPEIPEPALAMLDDGAGEGFGLVEDDPGSQEAGTPSEADANINDEVGGGSGDDTEGGDDDGDDEDLAVMSLPSVMVCGLVALVSTMLSASLF